MAWPMTSFLPFLLGISWERMANSRGIFSLLPSSKGRSTMNQQTGLLHLWVYIHFSSSCCFWWADVKRAANEL
ncbi:hypothetical protein V8C42DRAFT_308953 [Trichoderma barbatum]